MWGVGFAAAARRGLHWLGRHRLVLMVVAVVLAAGLGVWFLRTQATRDFRAALAVTRLESETNRVNGLELALRDGGAGGESQAVVALGAAAAAIEADVQGIEDLRFGGALRGQVLTYVSAVEDELELVERGDLAGAAELGRSRVDPLFAELSPLLDATSRKREADALAANQNSRILSAVVVGLALVIVCALVLRNERARAARERSERERDRLRDVDALKDALIGTVSHELRTPLTSIIGYTELLLEGTAGRPTAMQEEFLRVIRRNSQRLLTVAEDLLFLSRLDSGGLTLASAPVQLEDVLAESIETERRRAEQAEVSLSGELGPVTVVGDQVRLGQLFENLISNAIKFTPEGGSVHVSLGEEEGCALVRVSDTGMGLELDEREQVFERFFRTSRAEEHKIQGTGLGLSVAKTIGDAHGATISVESEPDRGSTFTVRLPLADGAVADRRVALAAPGASTS